jgi:hypothetical protein
MTLAPGLFVTLFLDIEPDSNPSEEELVAKIISVGTLDIDGVLKGYPMAWTKEWRMALLTACCCQPVHFSEWKWPKPADDGYQGIDNNQPMTPSDQAVVEGSNGWQSSRSVVNGARTMRLTKPVEILRTNSSDVLT